MSTASATQRIDTSAPPVAAPVASPAAVAVRKYAVELIGQFIFVFTVGTAISSGSPLAPLAIGAVLMVLVYAGGHISGGHYNPAVTVAALVRGRISPADAVGYWVAQFAGAALSALLVMWVVGRGRAAAVPLSGHLLGAAFVAELLFTFALTYVVLNVATSRDHPVNSFYGLAIGFTVFVGGAAVGGISGGVFNPAIGLGLSVMGILAWSTFGWYVLAQVVGGILGGLAFRALNPADK